MKSFGLAAFMHHFPRPNQWFRGLPWPFPCVLRVQSGPRIRVKRQGGGPFPCVLQVENEKCVFSLEKMGTGGRRVEPVGGVWGV